MWERTRHCENEKMVFRYINQVDFVFSLAAPSISKKEEKKKENFKGFAKSAKIRSSIRPTPNYRPNEKKL